MWIVRGGRRRVRGRIVLRRTDRKHVVDLRVYRHGPRAVDRLDLRYFAVLIRRILMKNIGRPALTCSIVTRWAEDVARRWIETHAVRSDSNGHCRDNLAIICIHHDHYAASGSRLAADE